MGHIIDLSKHQPSNQIDWSKFSKHVDLLILRVQYGSSVPDIEYKNHVSNAKKFNLQFHSYAFPRFISENDARVESRDAHSRQDGDSLSMIIDIEPEYDSKGNPSGIAKLPQSVRIAGIKAYVDELRKQGVKKVGAYVAHNIYDEWQIDTVKNLFDFVWIPKYSTSKPNFPCDLWQYTSTGNIPGYAGNLDLSVLNGNKSLDYFLNKQENIVAPTQANSSIAPVIPVSHGVIQHVRALVVSDIRQAPDHKAGFVRNTVFGEVFDVYAQVGNWHNVGGANWIDGNGGQNLFWIDNPNLVKPQPVYYVVKSGDTASKIASANGVTVQAIKDLNHMLDVNKIYVGQKLQLK